VGDPGYFPGKVRPAGKVVRAIAIMVSLFGGLEEFLGIGRKAIALKGAPLPLDVGINYTNVCAHVIALLTNAPLGLSRCPSPEPSHPRHQQRTLGANHPAPEADRPSL